VKFGKKIFILIITTLFITTINVDAQTNSDSSNKSFLFITTDKNSYKENDTIIVSGNVTALILDTPVALQVFHEGTWKVAAQIIVAQDGTFTHTIPTGGPQWQKDGTYTIRASYGSGHIAETSFDLSFM